MPLLQCAVAAATHVVNLKIKPEGMAHPQRDEGNRINAAKQRMPSGNGQVEDGEQCTEPIGIGQIHAEYPSGKTFDAPGKLYFAKTPNGMAAPFIEHDDGKSALVLDPRAIIKVDGKIVYHPRAYLAHLSRSDKDWLVSNPEWAPVGGLKGNARGAMPKGTRIRKSIMEKGDGHEVGALGTVSGSQELPDGRFGYSILWDDSPTVPVFCMGHKIEPFEADRR